MMKAQSEAWLLYKFETEETFGKETENSKDSQDMRV
jgi:hypothetical protein